MAVKKFTEIDSGSSISFSAAADVFRIDDEALSASDFSISSPSATTTQFVGGGKTITLGIPIEKITHSNVKFADGSKLLVGDDSLGTAEDSLDNVLVGTAHDDQILGLAGNDKLNGSVGADKMAGGTGDDTYVVDDEGDSVDENAGEGVDLVRSSISYTLGDEVENLVLTGGGPIDGTGNALDNEIKGNSGANVLQGLDGADTLTGGGGNDRLNGGDGVDSMAGGGGSDALVYSAGDSANGGADSDTLKVTAASLNLAGLAGGELMSIEVIDLVHATGALTLTAQQVKDLSETDTLRIAGGAGDSLDAAGTWARGANTVIDGQAYATFTLNGATLLVDTNIDRSETNVNRAPSGTDATLGLDEDSAYSFSAGNFGFTDPNGGDSLAAVRIDSLPTAGTLTLDGVAVSAGDIIAAGDLGDLVFTPAGNANGEAYATLTFSVQDGHGAFDESPNTLTLDVTGVNDAPVASDDTLTSMAEDSATRTITFASLTANDADGDAEVSQSLSITSVSNAVGGSVSIVDGHIEFTPDADFNGAASFDYTLSDGGLTDTGSASFTVTAVNDAPVAADDTLTSVAENSGTRTITFASLTGNDADGDAEVSQTLGITSVSNAVGGSVSIVDGHIEFTPDTDFNGTASFDYTLSDGDLTDTGSASFAVTGVNDAPVASDDTLTSVAEDSGTRIISFASLTGNDSAGPSNESGQALTVTSVSNVVGGSASIVNGHVEFTPNADYNGSASFDYTVRDNGQTNGVDDFKTDTGSVSFTVTAVNDAPVAADDTLTSVAEDSGARTITFASLLGNDADGDPEVGQALTITSVSNAVGGSVSIVSGHIEFTPGADFNGTVSFDYTVRDDGQTNGSDDFKTDTGSVTFTVTAVNDAPVAVDDELAAVEEDSATRTITFASLLGNDSAGPSNESGQSLTITSVSNAVGGSVSIVSGHIEFTLQADFNGTASFDYTVRDNGQTNGSSDFKTDTGSVSFAVTPVDEAPAVDNIDLSALDGTDGFRIAGVTASAFTGRSVDSAGDLNGDGFGDLIVGAPGSGGTYGAGYVVFGSASGFSASLPVSSLDGSNGFALAPAQETDHVGGRVAGVGDFNGDGRADFVIGRVDDSSYVVFGQDGSYAPSLDLSSLNGANGFRVDSGYAEGSTIATAGDVNGDGFDDLIIGASNGGSSYAGTSYVLFGAASGFGATFSLTSLDGSNGFKVNGAADYDGLGRSVSGAGDFNGDGFGDLIIGAPFSTAAGYDAGASYVVFGAASGFAASFSAADLDGTNGFRILGAAAGDLSGSAVSSAGDVNGDGFDDVVIGAPYADPHGTYSGAAYVVFGAASGFGADLSLSELDGTNGFRLAGVTAIDHTGFSVAAAGDVNGDGYGDLIVGANDSDANGTDSGAVYVVYGAASGFSASLDLSALDGFNGFSISAAAGFRAGTEVSAAGDVNGDGFDDLIVGAPFASPSGAQSGAAYVIYGGDFNGDMQVMGTAGNDTLSGGATDAFHAGAGNDRIQLADGAAFFRVDGGAGSDTLALLGSNDLLDFTALDANAVSGIEKIDLGNSGNTLKIEALDLLNLSDTGNKLVVDGGGTGTVDISSEAGWTLDSTSGGYYHYSHGEAKLDIATAISVLGAT